MVKLINIREGGEYKYLLGYSRQTSFYHYCSVIVGSGTLAGKVQKYFNWNEKSKIILRIKKLALLSRQFKAHILLAKNYKDQRRYLNEDNNWC